MQVRFDGFWNGIIYFLELATEFFKYNHIKFTWYQRKIFHSADAKNGIVDDIKQYLCDEPIILV